MKEFAPWEARKGSWARMGAERWLAQAHRKALWVQLEHHGTYALRRRLLHPQHFLLKH